MERLDLLFTMMSRIQNKNSKAISYHQTNIIGLTIHPGLWVAFKGLGPTPNLVLNVANIAHDPQESEKLDLSKIDFNWNNI